MRLAPVNLSPERRRWFGLAVITLPCVLVAMDLTVLNLAVPHLSADLKPTGAQLLWIIDVYGFFVAGSLITMGTLGDRIGRRRLLLIGATCFGITSMLAAFSTKAWVLICARALLGISGATIAPSTLSLIRNLFPDPKERAFAIGVWVTGFSVGSAIGPIIGGVLLEHFWWGSVFLPGVPVMVLLRILGPSLLPEYRDPNAGELDIRSAALSMSAVLALIFGFKEFAENGWGGLPIASVMLGVVLGILFVQRQRSLPYPLIDLSLFRQLMFTVSLAANTLSFFILGVYLFISQYMQLVLGMTPLQAGLWLIPSPLGFVVGSFAAPLLVRRFPPAYVMSGGLLLSALGFYCLTFVEGDSGLAAIVVSTVLYSLGLAHVFTLATDMVVGSAPPERAGAAAAISETSSEFGGALGIAVLGSLGMLVYSGRVGQAIPAVVPPEAAVIARGTLGGAISVAKGLPASLSDTLLGPAREAFAAALRFSASVSMVIAVLLAVLVVAVLRNMRPIENV